MWPTSSRSLRCALMMLARRRSHTHWGVHDGKYPVQRKSSLMRVDFRDFPSAPAGWFDDRFSDGRSKRSLSYDLLYLGGACRRQRLGVLSRVIFSPLRSAWSMWIWSGNQDEAADPAKETDGAYRCQMVLNGAKWCYPSVIATCYDRIGRRPWDPSRTTGPRVFACL